MNKSSQYVFSVVVALFASGCSTQGWYAGLHAGAEIECRKQPDSAAQDCLARLNKQTYEEYEKERSRASERHRY